MIADMGEALLIIDFQNDFNELATSGRYDLVIATRDWHPADHGSFVARGGPWPVHCVADTPGAQLHPALNQAAIHKIIDKGSDPTTEGYSAFEGTDLAQLLHDRGITKVKLEVEK